MDKSNQKGITLITLVITIIVLIILASIGTYTGTNLIRDSKYYNGVSELKVMQTKVNEMYDDLKSGNEDFYSGEDIPDNLSSKAQVSFETAKENDRTGKYIGDDLSGYKYYRAENISDELNIDGIDSDFLINVETRTVILLDGIKRDGKTYYSLNEIEDEQYNVEYINPSIKLSKNGGTYYIPKTGNLTIEITLTVEDKPANITTLKLEYAWSTNDKQAPTNWTTFNDGNPITITENEAGKYYLWTKITDTNNSVLYEKSSNAFVIKDTPLHTDVKYAVKHYQMDTEGNYPSTPTEVENLTGVEGTEVTPAVKTYVGFTSPDTQTVTIDGNGNTVVEYKYLRNKYELTLDLRDIIGTQVTLNGQEQTGVTTKEYYYGQTINLKAELENGYIWGGWTSSNPSLVPNNQDQEITFTMPAGAITLTPSNEVGTYTVTYDKNATDATGTMENGSATFNSNFTPAENGFTRTGYTFTGWNTAADGTGTAWTAGEAKKYETAGNITLYAQWETNGYEVIFNDKFPDEYQQVEYIVANGNQYIDTRVKTSQNLEIICSFSTKTPLKTFFGGRTSSAADSIAFGYFGTRSSFVGFGGATNEYQTTINLIDENIHTVDLSNSLYRIDGIDQTINNRNTLSSYNNIYLGTWNNNGVPDYRMFVGNIYAFKIYDNSTGSMVRNLIPCYRKSDNVNGLYDRVSNTFFTNAGSGAFDRGNNVQNDYTEVGKQQFVYGVTQNLTESVLTKDGYTFAGWNTKPDGTGTAYANKESVSNLTTENNGTVNLYAQWTAKPYPIEYNLNGGTEGVANPTSYTIESETITLNNPTKEGYKFTGWIENNRRTKFKCNNSSWKYRK